MVANTPPTTPVAPEAPARRVYPFEPYYDDQSSRGFNLLTWPPRLEWGDDGQLRLATLGPDKTASLEDTLIVETIWEHPRCPFVVLFTSWAVYLVTRDHFEAAKDHQEHPEAAASTADRDAAELWPKLSPEERWEMVSAVVELERVRDPESEIVGLADQLQRAARRYEAKAREADTAASLTEAFRALPADVQDRVGTRMAEHARRTIPNSELAYLAERPEIAALLAEPPEQQTSGELRTFEASAVSFAKIAERLENRRDGVADAVSAADRMMLAMSIAGIEVSEDPRWTAGAWYQRTDEQVDNVTGWILCLQALGDRPDLCAALVRRVGEKLHKAVLTDQEFEDNEV